MLDVLTIAGLTQALLTAAFFAARRRRPGAGYFAWLFLALAFLIFQGRLYYSGVIVDFPHLARLGFPVSACIGPLFYLVFREQIRGIAFRFRDIYFFAPAAAIFLYLVPFFLQNQAAKIDYVRQDLIELRTDCLVISYIALSNNLGFYLGTLLFLRRSRREFRNSGRLHLSLYIERTYVLQVLVGLLLAAMGLLALVDANLINSATPPVLLSILVMFLALHWIYFDRYLPFLPAEATAGKYEKSLLPEAEVQEHFRSLEAIFGDEHPYLDPDYRLAHAAGRLGLSSTLVSQVINRSAGRTFPEFVNEYRLAEARRRLAAAEYADHSILRIALDCGFNSKSSFNLIFKKKTGRTPREWRREHAASPDPAAALRK